MIGRNLSYRKQTVVRDAPGVSTATAAARGEVSLTSLLAKKGSAKTGIQGVTRPVPSAGVGGVKSMSDRQIDQLLVDRVNAGEKHAFDLLVVKYQQRLINLIMRYVHDHSEAMDVAQESFIKAYRALPKFRGESAFYTWLYRIAINTAKNHMVAARRRPLAYSEDIDDPERYEWHSSLQDNDSPEAQALGEELRETVETAISSLTDDLRTAIMLRELDGLSYDEIAQAMDCPVGTVRSRIFRAREAIDQSIRPLLDETS
ncbi:MAG: RNA polymerase sigma-70 factor (ECF subfamily) [Gammaproteobacteria bacterium]|jgi:RNA polymerase sigma-70 factor (ECF subfamily)